MVKSIRAIIYITILMCGPTACIDRIEVDTSTEPPRYVVDGFITDGPGPHYIRVEETIEFSNKANNPVMNATVQVQGSDGTSIDAVHQYLSVYLIPTGVFQAMSDVDYKIVINIGEFTIESEEQILPCLMPMTDLEFGPDSYVVQRQFDGEIRDQYGMLLRTSLAKTNDPVYYLWDIESGYEFVAALASDESRFKRCWFIEPHAYKDIYIHKDIEGGYKKDIVFAPQNIKHKLDYTMLFRQFNISQSAYKFWSDVTVQKENVGSIFDKTPSSVFGNLYSTSDPEERVLGYFGVYGFSEQRVFFNDLDYPQTTDYGDACSGPQGPYPRDCYNCLRYLGGGDGSNNKPIWWE